MAEVRIDSNDSFERALKKFGMQCKKEGIIRKFKERQYYTKPSQKRREKAKKKKRQ
jgi:small subunit ribosomal protein S21